MLRSVAAHFEEAAQQNGDRLTVEATRAPGVMFVDATKLRQILEQLVENAIAFTKEGEVTILAERLSQAEDDVVAITVADTGCGIAPERLDGFFDRLETVEEADERQERGAGVGLLLCKRLCELIGAELSLESVRPDGHEFHDHSSAARG